MLRILNLGRSDTFTCEVSFNYYFCSLKMNRFLILHMTLRPLLTLIFLIFLLSAHGQHEGQFIASSQQIRSPFTVTAYSTKHGLPQSQVIDIVARRDGSLILATANGIVEYDGQEFNEFIHNKGYRNHMCRKLLWDDQHKQLFMLQNKGGLYRFHPKLAFLGDATAATLRNGKLYLIDSRGTIRVSGTGKLAFRTLLHTKLRHTFGMHVRYPYLYVGGERGLHRIDLRNNSIRQLLRGDTIIDFRENPFTGKLYARSMRAVYAVGKTNAPVFYQLEDPNTAQLRDIAFISASEYYIATTKGLVYSGPDFTATYADDFLPSPYLGCLYYNSHEDFLMVGSGEKGLLKLQHKNCYTLFLDERMSGVSLSSIILDDHHNVLVAGSPGDILRIGEISADVYWGGSSTISCLSFIDGKVFVGSWGEGALVLKDRKPVAAIMVDQLPDGEVHAVFRDTRGMLWVGTGKGIARGRTPESIRPFLAGKVTGAVICFYETSDGNIFIGGSKGVHILDRRGKLIRTLSYKEGFAGKEVRSFYEDSEKKLWIGTYNGGLYCYDKGKLTSINRMRNCLLSQDVFTLALDEYGYFNITSNFGLWKVSEKDLNAFYHGKLDRLIPYYFGQETGILNTEFNGGFQNNYARSPHNHYFFPTIEGVVINMPEQFTFRRLETKMNRIWVNDSLYEGKPLFKRSTHTLKFAFSCARFSDKYNLHYQYKLIGSDVSENWSRLQRERTISFRMLPPGEYTLVVRAVDAFNDRHPKEMRYTFEIRSYFYETLWFRISVAIVLLLIVLLIIRMRVKQVQRKVRHANEINRTILELKLKAIQAKMNPHFIFNALNNIQYLIVLKKLDEAESTLTDFSQLLRKFLQQSDLSFVTVEDEFEMLRLYLAIEQFRLSNNFDSRLHIGEGLGQLYLPSMLLQPLVENALIHGLLHSDKEQRLHISATSDGQLLSIAIEDNGIGREASTEINKNRHEHVSHGIQLVREKIRIVHEKYGIRVDFQFIDIHDGQNTGTRVVFELPLLHSDPSAD